MWKIAVLSLLVVVAVGCSRKTAEPFSKLLDEAVYKALALSPVGATQAGYHVHKGVKLDDMLDDFSPQGIEQARKFFADLRSRLDEYKPAQLSAEDRADYSILSDQVALNLLEFDEIQSYRHNPTVYVELLGNALFTPYELEYAPKADRYRSIIARLKKIPAFLDAAKKNLADAPAIWNTVAQQENDGNLDLIDKTLRDSAPPELKQDFDTAAAPALDALRGFSAWLKSDLANRKSDWRLGSEKYAKKFRYMLETEESPAQVLAGAEIQLKAVRKRMFEISLPLHHKWYPTHRDPVDLNLIVSETLNKIAEKHAKPEKFFDEAKADLDQARQFVKERNLVPLKAHDNLQVIETPEFMRGLYGVGGFNPAPALEPQLGAFYWITPIPKDWPKERVESKLREYNRYGLQLLTLHEAMPGHYVQFEYANAIEPKSRRLLRGIWGNGPYIEGWAVYATQLMLDEGYMEHNPELQLTFLKQQLRMLANTILDVRLQTMGMTDQQAMDLMLKDTFQEKEEATAKLQRAKLSSTQLPTYYVGWEGWLRVRNFYKEVRGTGFQLSDFHSRALKEGAVPLPQLAPLVAKP